MTTDDSVTAQWYELFLDLWNKRYRLEQKPREWLMELWWHFGGNPLGLDEPSVIVTAVLLRVREDFIALDRATREPGEIDDEMLHRLRTDAQALHDRWAAVFRADLVA
ncbi:MAG TPA: hypothetical protein VFP80_07210 [Thermoanaerobaculia bacterium]|nr:hypothetical protein [Thermoanaerobaculia bacterium]